MKRLLHFAETLLARLALAVVPRLSRGAVLKLAAFFGGIAYALSGHLRNVGLTNLRIAYPDITEEERRALLRKSFRAFALVMLDTFWFSQRTQERVAALVRFSPGAETVFVPKPHICVTAHLGNWEVLGMAFSLQGYPLTSVAAPLENAAVDAIFNKLRETTGQRVVSKHGAMRPLLRTLKEGSKIALVLDQNTKPAVGGLFVEFFGKPVPVSSAAAALAVRTGAELVVGACIPKPDGTYEVTPPYPVPPPSREGRDETQLLQAFTQDITEAVERLIRQHPEHWLWTYKRWKYVAPGHKRDEFPFYAKELPSSET